LRAKNRAAAKGDYVGALDEAGRKLGALAYGYVSVLDDLFLAGALEDARILELQAVHPGLRMRRCSGQHHRQ
jgi:hypothetical protein